MITIYAKKITVRLQYTLTLIFEARRISYIITDDIEKYKNSPSPKLIYDDSDKKMSLISSVVLFDEDIQKYKIEKIKWRGIEVLSFNGVPDVLASIFYVVSLYDDYLQTEFDKHQRNVGKKSLLHTMGWLQELVVEKWSLAFIQYIEELNSCEIEQQKIPFSILPTFDIDHAYAYKYKGVKRNILSWGKDILSINAKRLKERCQVLLKKKKDPFATFDSIEKYARNFGVKVFWLVGDYGEFDTNLSHRLSKQRELIQEVNEFAEIGLHPSYFSNSSILQLQEEKRRLEDILNQKITISRQHFLKIKLPDTFLSLEKSGFLEDYSLAYADLPGFRGGISRPFFWFDLQENRISKLKLHPISYMDGTLKEYMNLDKEEAKKMVLKIKNEVQKYGGEFIPLWHNETIGNYGKWKGWREVLEVGLT